MRPGEGSVNSPGRTRVAARSARARKISRRRACEAGGAIHRFRSSDSRPAPAASRMAGEITSQRLMPPAKHTTTSCSVWRRFNATTAATNTATGRIRLVSSGRASSVTFRNTARLCRWSTIKSSALRLWLRNPTSTRAARVRRVGISSWRNR